MLQILIDTNCWIDLLSPQNERALTLIENWVELKKMLLLVPDQLLKEWEEKKEEQSNKIMKLQSEAIPKLTTFKEIAKIEHNNVEERVKRIDVLIKKAKLIKPSKNVLAEVTKRYRDGKAPFHRKNNNSNSDALLYLTVTDYLKKQPNKKFIFVTRDEDDFSNLPNKNELHPDLIISGIKTEYIFNIGNAIAKLKHELGDIDNFNDARNPDYVPIFQFTSPVKNLSVLESVYYSLKKYEDQITFIPTHILARIYPFRTKNLRYSYTYHSAFAINTNNKELAELFKEIETRHRQKNKKPDVDEFQKSSNKRKVNEIVRKLNDNMILEIHHVDHSIHADLTFVKNKPKKCVLSYYKRYDFLTAYKMLANSPLSNSLDTMKQAYVHFQFGNFKKSLELFYHVYLETSKKRKFIISFISAYNLIRLVSYIRGHYSKNEVEILRIIDEVDKISLYELELIARSDQFSLANIRWILNEEFYNSAFKEIATTVKKITDHYENQIAGGYGNNSNFTILLSAFGEIENFLDNNFVIYNNYSEFSDLTDRFTDGLFKVYGFDQRQVQRIEYIDESLILLISRFANRESLISYYNDLHLSQLSYKHTSSGEPSLEQTVLKIINDYKEFRSLYSQDAEGNLGFFWNKYRKMVANLLLFVSLSKSDKFDYNLIFAKLCDVLEDEEFFRKFDDAVVSEFIAAKGKYFDPIQIERFLYVAISNPKLHEHRIFYCLQKLLLKHHSKMVVRNTDTYNLILINFLSQCPKCKAFHRIEILPQIFPILSEEFKIDLSARLTEMLSNEFKPDLFYVFAIYEIVDYKLFFDVYLESSKPPSDKNKLEKSLDGRVSNISRLNEILNLAFKFNMNLNLPIFQQYQGISSYYDWLLNMDDFDYSKFDPLWIIAYKTEIYMKKIFTNEKVKNHLKKWLRKSKHPYISELYFKHCND